MRRWVLIMLLVIYPLQVALAMADQCCVTTPSGVTHHVAEGEPGASTLAPAFVADDGVSPLADPHCPACMLGHIIYLPPGDTAVPGQRHESTPVAGVSPFLSSPPAARPERPKWPARAD